MLVRPEFIICCLLFTATLFVYIPVVNYDFINYDDVQYITENIHVKHGMTADSIKWAFFSFHASNWHPVTWLSHMLDCQLYGLDPGKHHATNLLFHVLNTILLFFIFFKTTTQKWPSAFIAAFFALHPMHVESVAWIAERKDVLSTFFMMLTILTYIFYAKSRRRVTYWSAMTFFALGIMSKPMIVTLPFLLMLFDYWPLKRMNDLKMYPRYRILSSLIIEKIPFFILSMLSSYITVIAQAKGGAVSSLDVLPLPERFCNAFISYFKYIIKMVYPFNLSIFYPYAPKIDWPFFYISLLFLIFVSAAIIWFFKKIPWLFVGWFWYMGTLVPVIGIVQVGAQSIADRYTYIPFIGLFLIMGFGAQFVFDKLKYGNFFAYSSLLATAIFFMFAARFYVKNWCDSISIFQHSICVTKNNYIAYGNLGDALMKEKRILEAKDCFSEAIKIKPSYFNGHFNVGVCHMALDENEEAIKSFFRAVSIKPDFALAYYNIGSIYLKQKEYSKSLKYLGKAIMLTPDNARAYYKVGLVNNEIGDVAAALWNFQKSYSLGYIHAQSDIDKILRAQ